MRRLQPKTSTSPPRESSDAPHTSARDMEEVDLPKSAPRLVTVDARLLEYLLTRVEALKCKLAEVTSATPATDEIVANHAAPKSTPPRAPATPVRTPSPRREANEDVSDVQDRVLVAATRVAEIMTQSYATRQDLRTHKAGGSKLQTIIKRDDVEKLRKAIEETPTLVEMRYLDTGFTLLHSAASSGAAKICQYLVEELSWDVLGTDLFGRTPLHVAAENLHEETCRYFMERIGKDRAVGEGAPRDLAGMTPAGSAAIKPAPITTLTASLAGERNKKTEITKLLHERGDPCISPRPPKSALRRQGLLGMNGSGTPQAAAQPVDANSAAHDETLSGMYEIPGWRVRMEDASYRGVVRGVSVFAVFDGHGGAFSATECQRVLPMVAEEVFIELDVKADANQDLLGEAARRVVFALERHLASLPVFELRTVVKTTGMGDDEATTRLECADSSGTTVVLALVSATHFSVASVGDSRAALVYASASAGAVRGDALTRDHRLGPPAQCASEPSQLLPEQADESFFEAERSRVFAAGWTMDDRFYVVSPKGLSLKLAMSRTLGNFIGKQAGPNGEPAPLSIEPDLYGASRRDFAKGSVLVLACDGIWDVAQESTVASQLATYVSHPAGPAALERLAEEVCFEAFKTSHDNLSVILIDVGLGESPLRDSNEVVTERMQAVAIDSSASQSRRVLSFEP